MSTDAESSGVIGDAIDAMKRGVGGLRDKAAEEIGRLKRVAAEERRRRTVRLMVFGLVAYLLWRGLR